MEKTQLSRPIFAEPVKEINVQLAGQVNSKRITIAPKTTAGEVINREVPAGRQMNLTPKPGQTPFAPQDMIYDSVSDGDTLFAVPAPTFG